MPSSALGEGERDYDAAVNDAPGHGDWLDIKRDTLAELSERYGAEFVGQHREALEAEWRYVADFEGFDPDTGKYLEALRRPDR